VVVPEADIYRSFFTVRRPWRLVVERLLRLPCWVTWNAYFTAECVRLFVALKKITKLTSRTSPAY